MSHQHGTHEDEGDAARSPTGTPETSPFRSQALAHRAGPGDLGQVFRLTPGWVRGAYWLVLAAMSTGLVFLVFGTVTELAAGPAVVRAGGIVPVAAGSAGQVVAIEAREGQIVVEGSVILRLEDRAARAEWRRAAIATAGAIRAAGTTGDPPADRVEALFAGQEPACARLERRLVRAPSPGVVEELTVQVGQVVGPGLPVATLRVAEPEISVIARLPARHAGRLTPGAPIRIELVGVPDSVVWASISRVGGTDPGPPHDGAAASEASGATSRAPTVWVEASLPPATIDALGAAAAYRSGAEARVEVPLGRQRLIRRVVPWTRRTGSGR